MLTFAVVPFLKERVFSGFSIELYTDDTLTLIISSWLSLDRPYANVLTPTVVVSARFFVRFVIPKNWVKDFEVYDTTPVVVSVYVTYSSPVVPNPTVESTSRTEDPEETSPITLVDGSTFNSPYWTPSTLISLLYPPSKFNL